MIDAARWVLVEAWLSLGLRVRWAMSFEEAGLGHETLIADEQTSLRYFYSGSREWVVLRPGDRYRALGFPQNDAPMLGTETLRHELAHYLIATADERGKRNFGLDAASTENEARALESEAVIDAIIRGANSIVSSLIAGNAGRS